MSTSINYEPIRAGIFITVENADRAVANLLDAGFQKEEITVICSDESKEQHFGALRQSEGITKTDQEGVGKSGVIGGVLGALVSLAGVATTGGMGIVAIGPIFAGGLTGTLLGIFVGSGVENELARFYDQAVAQGNILVAVDLSDEDAQKAGHLTQAGQILEESGASPLPLSEG
ncbi:hypothetical protein CA54_31850 [Symmachiella macrocystis]|uniref:Heat induced stress protein YflT n=1 Tax=Symmachiella macrocystis TaxID=2527985 RepID=A0A5C6BQ35_9PLAN|nr:hypothetical protein [Symmachiella macrocystis]TWU14340.1 hypothetical protein CA54_31850 [Symmachiella macrocystis]